MTKPDKPQRPSMSKARRIRIWERDKGICYLCGLKVQAGEAWDADHRLAWEISRDDSDENIFVAHKDGCHSEKTKTDRKAIARCQRMAGETGQQARRAKRDRPLIPSRPFAKSANKKAWPKRSFEKRKPE